MTTADPNDMVIRLGPTPQQRALTHAQVARSRRSLTQRATAAAKRIARRAAPWRVASGIASGVAKGALARAGLSAVGRAAGLGAGATAGVLAVIAAAAAAAVRLGTGRPFEATGEVLNRKLLGDLDDQGRASSATREYLAQNDAAAFVIGSQGYVNGQVRSAADREYQRRLRYEKGASLLREEFASNGTLDMLILRGAEMAVEGWKRAGGPEALQRLRGAYDQATTGGDAPRGR